MDRLTEEEIEKILNDSGVANPFRYSEEVARDFQLNSGTSDSGDVFRDFVQDELRECADVPVSALAAIAADLMEILDALHNLSSDAPPHSFFSRQQVCVIQTYLGGDMCFVLQAGERDQALDILNEVDGDRFKRLMLAALDARNAHSPGEVDAMFTRGVEQIERALAALETLLSQEE